MRLYITTSLVKKPSVLVTNFRLIKFVGDFLKFFVTRDRSYCNTCIHFRDIALLVSDGNCDLYQTCCDDINPWFKCKDHISVYSMKFYLDNVLDI